MLDNRMPFEALYRTPPDLLGARLWGCKVWVHNDSGSKLDVCAYEGWLLGFDVDSQAHRIYWPDSTTVSVKWNVYFASAVQLEGEELQILVMNSKQTATPDTPTTPITPTEASAPAPEQQPAELCRSTCICKPLQIICNLQSSEGIAHPNTNALSLEPGLQVPAEDPEEAGGV